MDFNILRTSARSFFFLLDKTNTPKNWFYLSFLHFLAFAFFRRKFFPFALAQAKQGIALSPFIVYSRKLLRYLGYYVATFRATVQEASPLQKRSTGPWGNFLSQRGLTKKHSISQKIATPIHQAGPMLP